MTTAGAPGALAGGIETARLALVPAGIEHRAAFVDFYCTPEVMAIRKLGVLDRDEAGREHERLLAHWRAHGFGMYAVRSRAGGAFIGECGLRWLEDGSEVELSYGYLPQWWGRGLATEAASATLAAGLAELARPRIIAFSRGDNAGSHRVLEKAGMRLEARFDRGPHGVVRYVVDADGVGAAMTVSAWAVPALVALAGLAVAGIGVAADSPAPPIRYRVLATFPHDPQAFTQGLVAGEGALYESTGLRGHSTLRKVDLESGRVIRQRRLASALFGEGLARVGDRLVQLTWTAGQGFVHRVSDFALVGRFQYPGEGWGLTYDGRSLIMSDGTPELRFLDPETFGVTRRLRVADAGVAIARLNELEFVAGRLYANVWQTSRIAEIDPGDGRVTGWIDLAPLVDALRAEGVTGVANGIAYDGRLLVTGKHWPRLFALELLDR